MKKGLHIENQWESLSYYFDGRRFNPSLCTGVQIRWPDGTEEAFPVRPIPRNQSYQDHGHTYTVTQILLWIEVDHRGAPISLPLGHIDGLVAGVTVADGGWIKEPAPEPEEDSL